MPDALSRNMQKFTSFDDFDNIPTAEIPEETMRQLIYGEGHAPIGPDRPTRDIGMPQFDMSDVIEDTIVDDVSDGIPQVEGSEDTVTSGGV